jgi:hypothetical protein
MVAALEAGQSYADNGFGGSGSVIIDTVTFANNSATGGNGGNGGQIGGACGQHGQGGFAYGGAITNNNGATLNIKHSTISGNNAQAGNTGVNQGGATKPPRPVGEGTGGGLRVGAGAVTIENTIVAGNTAANGLGDTSGAPVPGPDVDGTVTSNGHNLIGNAAEAIGFTGTGDQMGVDPLLAPLANMAVQLRRWPCCPAVRRSTQVWRLGRPLISAGCRERSRSRRLTPVVVMARTSAPSSDRLLHAIVRQYPSVE